MLTQWQVYFDESLECTESILNFGLSDHGPTAHVLFALMLKGP
jgi:hypothetical protein